MPTRRPTVAAAGWLMLVLLRSFATAPAVSAHAGNRLQLYVDDLAVRPATAGSWTVQTEVVDADSGRPAPGFDVVASGTMGPGGFGPVTLDDPANTGSYEAIVSGPSGPWTITVDAKERPGSEAAVPFARTWHVVVTEAGTAQAGRADRASAHRSAGPAWPLAVTVGGLGTAVVAIGVTRRYRRLTSPC